MRRELEGHEAALGAEHADTVRAVGNLAALLLAQGRMAEAAPLAARKLQNQSRDAARSAGRSCAPSAASVVLHSPRSAATSSQAGPSSPRSQAEALREWAHSEQQAALGAPRSSKGGAGTPRGDRDRDSNTWWNRPGW